MHKANLRSATLRLAFLVCLIIVHCFFILSIVEGPFSACADVLFGESCHETIRTYLKVEKQDLISRAFIVYNTYKLEG